MTGILTLKSGDTFPFVITSPNADPFNPLLEDTVFDGNQQPLLVKQKGSIYIPSGPGWGYGPGGYAGVSTPISNPYPTGRHYVVGLGYAADGVRRTPFQTNALTTLTYNLVGGSYVVYAGAGIGVATDATNVWGLSSYTPTPNTGFIGGFYIYIGGYPYGHYQFVSITGWIGTSTPRPATVSYMLFENTIGG